MRPYQTLLRIGLAQVGCLLLTCMCFAQKWDYNFFNRSTSNGSAVYISFSDALDSIEIERMSWDGTAAGCPSLSDRYGHFKGFFNSRNLYDSVGRVAINGDSMAVGYYQNYLFSFLPNDEGLGNAGNCAFIPISDSLYFLIYKSSELWIGAPDFAIKYEEKGIRLSSYSQNIYLTKVRVTADGRLYVRQEEKHLILEEGLFQMRELLLCKHANSKDWWLLCPHAQDGYASRMLIDGSGDITRLPDIWYSDQFWRVRSMTATAFHPNGSMLARLLVRPNDQFENILEIFELDRCIGELNRIFIDSLSLREPYTSKGDVEFSGNGRFLYLALGSHVLQYDLSSMPILTSKADTVAVWDGSTYHGFPILFDDIWKLPNGKMLLASMVSTPYLHYIKFPDLAGDACGFIQRAIQLPADPLNPPFNIHIRDMPAYPNYRMAALSSPCETGITSAPKPEDLHVQPNPASEKISVTSSEGSYYEIWSVNGQPLRQSSVSVDMGKREIDVSDLVPGLYLILFLNEQRKCIARGKFVKS